jgi:hypothetical protein
MYVHNVRVKRRFAEFPTFRMCIHILLRNICIQLHVCEADLETLEPDLETFCEIEFRRVLCVKSSKLLALLGLKCPELMVFDPKLR